MAAAILSLSDGGVSLEFAIDDTQRVKRAIKARFGRLHRRWYVLSADVQFGGEHFVFQNEWNDPCLISRSDMGAEMLRLLAADLDS